MAAALNLTVSEFSKKSNEILYFFQQESILCDCVIQCRDGPVSVHKIILAMWGVHLQDAQNINALQYSTTQIQSLLDVLYLGTSVAATEEILLLCDIGSLLGVTFYVCDAECMLSQKQSAASKITLKEYIEKDLKCKNHSSQHLDIPKFTNIKNVPLSFNYVDADCREEFMLEVGEVQNDSIIEMTDKSCSTRDLESQDNQKSNTNTLLLQFSKTKNADYSEMSKSAGVEDNLVSSTGYMPPKTSVEMKPTADILVSSTGYMPPHTSVEMKPTADSLVSSTGYMPPKTSVEMKPTADSLVSSTGYMPPHTSVEMKPTADSLVSSTGYMPPHTSVEMKLTADILVSSTGYMPPHTSVEMKPTALLGSSNFCTVDLSSTEITDNTYGKSEMMDVLYSTELKPVMDVVLESPNDEHNSGTVGKWKDLPAEDENCPRNPKVVIEIKVEDDKTASDQERQLRETEGSDEFAYRWMNYSIKSDVPMWNAAENSELLNTPELLTSGRPVTEFQDQAELCSVDNRLACTPWFPTKDGRRLHESKHFKSKPQKVKVSYKNKGNKASIKQVDDQQTILETSLTMLTPARETEISSTVNTKSIERKMSCKECGQMNPFTYQSNKEGQNQLFVHRLNNHPNAFLSDVICDGCGHVFSKVYAGKYWEHRYRVHGLQFDESKFPKLLCGMEGCTFWSLNEMALKKHRKHTHPSEEEMNIKCPVCDAILRTYASLQSHIYNQHSANKKRMYLCEICGEQFTKASTLENHIDTKHHKTEKFARHCHICNMNYKSVMSFNTHLLNVHKQMPTSSRSKIYSCQDCDFKTLHKTHLKRHEVSHKALKGFAAEAECDKCGKAFMSACRLKTHYRNVHGNTEKCPYDCGKICNKRNMRRHITLVHEKSIKQHSCHLCNYKTNLHGNLVKHIRDVHKVKVDTLFSLRQRAMLSGKGYAEITHQYKHMIKGGNLSEY